MLYDQLEYMKKNLAALLIVQIIFWRLFYYLFYWHHIAKYKHVCFIHDHNGEATGHYGNNLEQFLKSCNFIIMEINPFLIKQFSKASTLRKTKTDKIDSVLISRYITTVDYKPISNLSYYIQTLKSLSRLRDSLVKLTVVLDIIFPEYKSFFNNKLSSSTCIYILENYGSPEKISRINTDSYDKMKRKLRLLSTLYVFKGFS